jgi:hypothetical protein
MPFTPSNLVALITAASFAAGLNVYATVLTLGLLGRYGWVALPPGLEVLGDTWVLVASGMLFGAEFFADKIPGFDMVWNAAHTVVRVPVAALLAYRATDHLSPGMQLLATAAGAGIALAAHSSKTAIRAIVTPSPEPVSNIALSTTEDAAAIGLTWTAAHHPWVGAGIALGLLVGAVAGVRWVVRRIQRAWSKHRPSRRGGAVGEVLPPAG